jgi:decaprenyl-phosphate phosphoribosyltransferase
VADVDTGRVVGDGDAFATPLALGEPGLGAEAEAAEPVPPVGSAAAPALGRTHLTALLGLFRAMRPRQWVKNLLVFVAPASAGVLDHPFDLLRTVAAFGITCAAASGVYLVNDAADVGADRRHPDKRHRPLARGAVSVRSALELAACLIVLAMACAWLLGRWQLMLVIGIYVTISLAYTLRLKREPVLELVALASGFVIRAIVGGVATHVPLSNWLLVVTSFGALFVVTGKRAAEYWRLGARRAEHRAVLAHYTASFLQSTLIVTASVTMTAYCLWAFERTGLESHAGHHFIWIQLTVVPIVVGLLYTLRLIDSGDGGAPEELVLRDGLLQVLGLVWLALFTIGLYG